jgi:aminoglycoside phosphotransferase (APT) family kinase protein
MTGRTVLPNDIVATHADAADGVRVPLLVLEPLAAFLDGQGLGSGTLAAEAIGAGRSNATFLLRRDGLEVVLRRPPRPPLPPSAHDVLREARLLRALEPTPARTPRVLATCDDDAVIGAPFVVMEKVGGRAVGADLPTALDNPEQRLLVSEELVDALVEIHAVDWRAAGLEGFGRPTGYLERQLRRFGGLWEHNRTRDLPAVERVGRWLADHLPESGPATLVHGDYRLGNTMYGEDSPARLTAVLDWELATVGDPLADLGYLCALWAEAEDPPLQMLELSAATRSAGFLDRAGLAERYGQRSGRTLGDLRWYETLALWKALVYMEGNYRRAMTGLTDDPFLASFGEGVVELAERAEAMTRRGDG